MNDERKEQFRVYLDQVITTGTPVNKEANIKKIIGKVKKVELQLGVNLDTEGRIGRQAIFASLEPTDAIAENRHPNQNTMGFPVREAEGTPHSIRTAIKYYRTFCGDPVEAG